LTSLRHPGPRARVRPRRPFQHVTVPARHRGGHQCPCPSRRVQPTAARSGRTSARRDLSTAPPPFPTQVDLPCAVLSPAAPSRSRSRSPELSSPGEKSHLPEPSSAAYKRGPTAPRAAAPHHRRRTAISSPFHKLRSTAAPLAPRPHHCPPPIRSYAPPQL
jgi:hypothetical protein